MNIYENRAQVMLYENRILVNNTFLSKINKEDSILELGCGNGSFLSNFLNSIENPYIGIDINPVRISEAKECFKDKSNLQFLEMDMDSDKVEPLLQSSNVMVMHGCLPCYTSFREENNYFYNDIISLYKTFYNKDLYSFFKLEVVNKGYPLYRKIIHNHITLLFFKFLNFNKNNKIYLGIGYRNDEEVCKNEESLDILKDKIKYGPIIFDVSTGFSFKFNILGDNQVLEITGVK